MPYLHTLNAGIYAAGQIELNPYYQRDVVWTEVRQSGLINSIFNNYYVPPVIFQCRRVKNDSAETANGGKRTILYRTAIDGKQRLSSIINFRAGRIPYKDFRGTNWWYPCFEAKAKLKNGKVLTASMKEQFDNWSLLCIEYTGLTPTQEEELFSRVQQGMALSNSERQMAGHTPWIRMIKELLTTYKEVVNICDGLKRGKDFGYTANVCVMVHYRHKLEDDEALTLKTSSAVTDKIIKRMDDGEPTTKYQKRIRKLFSVWADLLDESPETFTNRFTNQSLRKFSPVEYIATGVFIEKYMDTRDNDTLIKDIYDMRKWIRTGGKVIDLRTNGQTWDFFWHYIASVHRRDGVVPERRVTPPPISKVARKAVGVPKSQLILPSGPLPVSESRKNTPKKKRTSVIAPPEERTPVRSHQDDREESGPRPEQPQFTEPAPQPAQQQPAEDESDDEIFRKSSAPPQPPIQQPYPQTPQFPAELAALWQQAHIDSQRNGVQQPVMMPPQYYQPPPWQQNFPFPQYTQASPQEQIAAMQQQLAHLQSQVPRSSGSDSSNKRKRIKLGLDDE